MKCLNCGHELLKGMLEGKRYYAHKNRESLDWWAHCTKGSYIGKPCGCTKPEPKKEE